MARITGLTKDVSTIELRLRRDGAEMPLQAGSDAEASTGARSPSPQRRLRRADVGQGAAPAPPVWACRGPGEGVCCAHRRGQTRR